MVDIVALLFDLDGTLVDTSLANYLAYRDALNEVGVDIDPETFEKLAFGRNWRQFLPELLGAAGSEADPVDVAARKRALYPNHSSSLRLNKGLLSLARSARPAQKTALVTTASAQSVDSVMAPELRRDLFNIEVTGDDVTQHKPAPDAYLLAAERLGVEPSACLVFEDSDIGVASAISAGMAVVRVRI